ncbi:MAG: hypothetical protein ACRBCK_05025 [Alphaproteobacteria bacterium]
MVLFVNFKGILRAAILLLWCSYVFIPVVAHADDVITEQSIEEFYQYTVDSLLGADGDWDKVVSEWDALLHEEFKATMRLTMDLPGHGTVTPVMSYNKSLYLHEIKLHEMLDTRVTKMDISVEKVEISVDGKMAHVTDKSFSMMDSKAVGKTGGRDEMILTSRCNDIIVLDAHGDIVSEIPKDL